MLNHKKKLQIKNTKDFWGLLQHVKSTESVTPTFTIRRKLKNKYLGINLTSTQYGLFLAAQLVKNLPAMQGTLV